MNLKRAFAPSSVLEQARDLLRPSTVLEKYGLVSTGHIKISNPNDAPMIVDSLSAELSIAAPGEKPNHTFRSTTHQIAIAAQRDTIILMDFRMNIEDLSVETFDKIMAADPLGYHITTTSFYHFEDEAVCSDSVLFAAVDSLNNNSDIEAEVLGNSVTGTTHAVLWSIENYETFVLASRITLEIIGALLKAM